MKKLSSEITGLVSSKISGLVFYSVHGNVWELWLFTREFPVAVILSLYPPPKSRFM